MKHAKLFVLALTALIVLGAVAASAVALPDISLTLTGSAYPLKLKADQTKAKTSLTNMVGEKISGEGVLLLLTLTALGHLGTFELLFTKAKKDTTACRSEEGGVSDPAEELLTKGSWHLVYTSLPGTPALALGILYLISPVTFKCGTETIGVKGDMLSSVNSTTLGTSEATEYTAIGSLMLGNLKIFYNEAGTVTKALLEANFGTGFKELSGWKIEEEVTPAANGTNMFLITSR